MAPRRLNCRRDDARRERARFSPHPRVPGLVRDVSYYYCDTQPPVVDLSASRCTGSNGRGNSTWRLCETDKLNRYPAPINKHSLLSVDCIRPSPLLRFEIQRRSLARSADRRALLLPPSPEPLLPPLIRARPYPKGRVGEFFPRISQIVRRDVSPDASPGYGGGGGGSGAEGAVQYSPIYISSLGAIRGDSATRECKASGSP